MTNELTDFFGQHPRQQNALDLFKGQWSTRLPDSSGLIASSGPGRFCEDYRVKWAARELGGLSGKRVLELGPLEGGHTYMLEHQGAAEILSIEGSGRAYLKSLILKEIFGLTRARFLLGDFLHYLRESPASFDVAFACGVLYHQKNPVEFIQLLSRSCEAVFVWTHYYDAAYLAEDSAAASHFVESIAASVGGFDHTLHRRHYADAREWKGFCGGGENVAAWLTASAILAAFEYFGFSVGSTVRETNANGPALMFVARRRK